MAVVALSKDHALFGFLRHKLALKEYEEILQYGDRNPEAC